MAKARIYGMKTKYIPNSKADRKRNKPFGTHKKGMGKKCNVLDATPMGCLSQIPDQMEKP